MKSSPIKFYSAHDAQEMGVQKSHMKRRQYLADRSDWIICHLDVDSIDPSVISAVNYREKNGFTLKEVSNVIDALQKTGKMKVFNLTAYNPTLDPDLDSGRKLVKLTTDIFSTDTFH